MDLTPRDHDDVGVWALDAADAGELARIEAALAEDPALTGEADRLREVVAHLAEPLADTPPARVRAGLLAAAAAARPVGSSAALPEGGASAIDVYAATVEQFHSTVSTLAGDDWDRAAAPYRWTVHGLLAHLLAVERFAATVLGVPGAVSPVPPHEAGDHIAFAEPFIADTVALSSPDATIAAWRAAADATLDHLTGLVDLDAGVVFHGFPMSLRTMLIARGFELWTHDDDIRRAVGRPVSEPRAAVLRSMAEVAVGGLPGMLLLVDRAELAGRAHVVLTGDGGGTWDVRFGAADAEGPEVTLVADVVDWCRLAARRLSPQELDLVVEGDAHLAGPLLLAAQALSF